MGVDACGGVEPYFELWSMSAGRGGPRQRMRLKVCASCRVAHKRERERDDNLSTSAAHAPGHRARCAALQHFTSGMERVTGVSSRFMGWGGTLIEDIDISVAI